MPPATAPGIEPKPPSTAAVKPLMTIRPIFEERKTTGATSTPATAPTIAARIHDVAKTRSTLMPISRAARWFCATAHRTAHSRPGEQRIEHGHERQRRADDSERYRRQPHRADRDRPRAEERREGKLVVRPHEPGQRAEDQRQPEG